MLLFFSLFYLFIYLFSSSNYLGVKSVERKRNVEKNRNTYTDSSICNKMPYSELYPCLSFGKFR